ncbi:MAG: TonB-dependent receptor plug domain-containing protein [Paraprevotella sp.]|nr:TonB-dependent receptor plug domain-containing protein [Paraprevotella sp.]
MQTVEVKADRKERNDRTVSVQSITREQIQEQGITDLADALRRMSGTNIRDYGGAGGMKTLSVRSMGATHTGVVYDGMAVTDCESGQIDLSRFSLEQADRLTLVVGDNADIFVPARTLASAATLYLSSEAPDFTERHNRWEAQVTSGAFGYVNPHIKFEQRLRTNWSMRLQADYLRADNRYPFTQTNHTLVTREKRANNALKNGTAELDIYYRPQSARSFQGKIYYYDSWKQLPGQVIYYNPVNHESQRFRNAFGQAHFQTRWGSRWAYQANLKANYAETHYRDEGLQYPNHVKENIYQQQEYYASMSLFYTPLAFLSFSLSSDYAYTTLSSDAIDTRRPFRHSALESVAAKYDQGDITATATLLVSVFRNGAKEGKQARDAHRLSPSVALAWRPGQGCFTWRASYKDIFRMPTFTDNYYTWLGNRDLLPEIARQFSTGLTLAVPSSRHVLKSLEMQTDLYYNKVTDKIVAMPMNMFYWNMVNVGKVDIMGVDTKVSTGLEATKWLRLELNANYTYQYAVNVTSPGGTYYKDQIAYTPSHSGGGAIALLTPWLNVSLHGTAVSERYSTNANMDLTRLKPYHEIGLAAYRDFHWRKFGCMLRADLMNLTNEQYEIVRLYPMPGRSWKITIKFIV